jgi:hypothetical protein
MLLSELSFLNPESVTKKHFLSRALKAAFKIFSDFPELLIVNTISPF